MKYRLFLNDATNGGIIVKEQYKALCGRQIGKYVDFCTYTTSIEMAQKTLDNAKNEGETEIFNHSIKIM